MSTKKNILMIILAGALVLSACSLPAANPPTPDAAVVAQTVQAVQTQAVQTVAARLTADAALIPTATPTEAATNTPEATATPQETSTAIPSLTPLPTLALPTLAPTIIIPVHTATPAKSSTPSAYTCQVTEASPAANAVYPPGGDFDARWVVKNIGTKAWDQDNADFHFVSGTKMMENQSKLVYDLPNDVAKGAKVTLILDMLAPKTPGYYSMTWAISMNGSDFCRLTTTIRVK